MIGQFNIQSIKPKLIDLRHDLSHVHDFHLLALSETWLSPNIPNRLLTIDGYTLYRCDRPKTSRLPKGYGGAALLARTDINVEVLDRPTTGTDSSNIEIIWALVRLDKHKRMLFASAYRHPTNTASQLALDFDDLESQLQFMLASHPGEPVIIAGDLNACLLSTASSTSTPSYKLGEIMRTYGLSACNTTSPTYRPAGTLIDVIITNQPELVVKCDVTRCHYGGPHDFTRALVRYGPRTKVKPPTTETRLINRVDSTDFNITLADTDWGSVFAANGPTAKWDHFTRIFTTLLDTVAPLRRVRRHAASIVRVTESTRALLAERRAALAAGQPERDNYKAINRRCRAAVRRDSREHLQQRLTGAGPSRVYRVLAPIIGSKKAANTVPSVTPDAINDYFVNVGPRTAASVIAPTNPPPTRLPRVPSCGFRVSPISENDLCITVANMKKSSSIDSTGFSIAMFQRFFFGLQHVLCDIINSSLISGVVPDAWKHGIVVPLPKGGTTTDPANWRPVTTLPAISKIIERTVHNQLSSYFTENTLYSSAQHGYRRNHSTETALTVVTDSIYKAMDEGKITILVLLDCTKCFDVISHPKLLDKLSMYGVDNHWFNDYLQNHKQQVKIVTKDGTKIMSRSLPNTTGVYQGGSLSCLLYSIFSNELNLYSEQTKLVLFADDTQIMISGHKQNIHDMITCLESELAVVFDWFAQNSLKLNSSKTQVIVFGTRAMLRDLPTVSIRVGNDVVSERREVKNLGVYMDRYLTFGDHIDHVVRKCTGTLIALVHLSHGIPVSMMKQIVVALVLSMIRYCISIYGTCGATQLHRIQKLINFCARVISRKSKYDHISQEVRRLGLMTAQQLVTYHQMCLIRRILVTGEPRELSLFSAADHEHRTRYAHRLVTVRARTCAGERRIFNGGVRKYNDLPTEVRDAVSMGGFKRALERVLLYM